jgi:hypothetical protein
MKKVIYTCIFNDYDTLMEPGIITKGWRYILITDRQYESNIWESVIIDTKNQDIKRLTRRIFALPWEYFNADISMLISGRVMINVNLDLFIKKYVKPHYDLIIAKHPHRNCIYDEAQVIINRKIDNINLVQTQMSRYKNNGYPRKNGLVAAGMMIRIHNASVKTFCELWWNETSKGSYRDQLSFNYVLWLYKKLRIAYFPFKYRNKMFIIKKHKRYE